MNKTSPVRISTKVLDRIRKKIKGTGFTLSGFVNFILTREMNEADNGGISYWIANDSQYKSKSKK